MKLKHLFACLSLLLAAMALGADKAAAPGKPQIEVAFVLDTTGSMSGLIEGAKAKIWSIANEMLSATDPKPQIKIALVAYRDLKDDYVTKVFDLTDDLDTVYKNLQGFAAAGGGDEPESVNQALLEAVTKLAWSKDRNVAKIIFLVGDAPPHMDYANDIKYPEVCQQAVKKDIIINTVQCGSVQATGPVWKEIAKLSEGAYVQLGQTGNMTVASTPVDKDIAKVSEELNKTVLAYGKTEQRAEVMSKMSAPAAGPAPAAADRATYNLGSGGKAVQGKGDLVNDVKDGQVKLETLKEAELPDELKGKSGEEQKAVIAKNQAKRDELNQKLGELTQQRAKFLREDQERRTREGKGDAFDETVSSMVRQQAAKKLGTTQPTTAPSAQPAK